ncbi:MAG TPA: M20 family metallopeptidase [Chloroflexota bacterium]
MNGAQVAADVRRELEPRRAEMIDLLGRLVSVESPSDDRACLDRCAVLLESVFDGLGALERVEPDDADRGQHLRLEVQGADGEAAHAVALCHYDTVWRVGTLGELPFDVDAEGVARGPGCFDMKGGIVVLYFALRALRDRGLRPRRRLEVLFTSDEEIGSRTSRPLIERAAEGAAVVYVLESPLPGGTLKTARKGTGDYLLRITGRAAHAGVEPEKGISAIGELAHQILALQALNDYARGTTVNVGVVRGGTRSNVVAAEAEAHIDVRVASLAEASRLDAAIRGLQPRLAGAVLDIAGGLNRPPMERSAAMAALFERARQIAAAMNVELHEGSTGGGSDGNFTAAMGVPTLDGLGPEGEGAHAAHEHVLTHSFPRRVALLAGLLVDG